MDKWSSPVEEFRINIFLDTNILVFLLDNTYPALTGFIKTLSEMSVVQLYSSEYVLSELIGVRKKEGYFQVATKKAKKEKRYINISSFIKYNKRYDIPNYSLDGDMIKPVAKCVMKYIETIVKDYNISFDSIFNDRLLSPMEGVCLSSKVSREDSLVMVSSLFRLDKQLDPNRVFLLTNDEDFEKWSTESSTEIEKALKQNGLSMPHIEHISKLGKIIPEHSTHWNMVKTNEDGKKIALKYVEMCLMWLYGDKYIGIITPAKAPNAPKHTLFVKVKAPKLKNGLYTLILTKDFKNTYSPKNKADFYLNGKSIKKPFIPKAKADKVGYVCEMKEGEAEEEIFGQLNKKGNLVFIHPDSI